jgi:hypothetical protein
MAMTPAQKRRAERERKREQRAAARAAGRPSGAAVNAALVDALAGELTGRVNIEERAALIDGGRVVVVAYRILVRQGYDRLLSKQSVVRAAGTPRPHLGWPSVRDEIDDVRGQDAAQ